MRGAADVFLLVLSSCGSVIIGCHYIPPVDPCEGVTCSGHGLCVSGAENAVCQCEAGYRADELECVLAAADGDGDSDGDVEADGDVDGDSGSAADADGDAESDSDGDLDGGGDADVDVEGDGEAEPRCEDGERQEGEECDDGAANSDVVADACRTDCRLPWCGDGVTDGGEACDDGNGIDVDGCRDDCTTCELVLEERRGGGTGLPSSLRLWVGDLDDGGLVDTVVSRGSASESSIEVGLHDGVWLPLVATSYAAATEGTYGGAVAVGDVTGDGALDVVMACHVIVGGLRYGMVTFVGRGDGAFDAPSSSVVGRETAAFRDIALGHTDHDARLDAIVGTPVDIRVYRGRAGGFISPSDEVLYVGGDAVEALDVDGDGDLDIVSVATGADSIAVSLGAGDGTFADPVSIATGSGPVDLVLGDLDEDGAQDAVVANAGDETMSIHLNDGAGALLAASARALSCTPVAAAGGDANLDGHLDVVVACTGPDQVVVLLGDGTGLLPREVTAALGSAPVDIGLGDLDGDLDPEVITLNAGGMGVLEVDCH